jgi:hypothetical protein
MDRLTARKPIIKALTDAGAYRGVASHALRLVRHTSFIITAVYIYMIANNWV